mmetsp:Transcript_10240/g.30421  ORF Transcript_10240/g.30421 Transcript_10240/m.30421 type:complete len:247 (+) Transcript_10240:2037-2777(+)
MALRGALLPRLSAVFRRGARWRTASASFSMRRRSASSQKSALTSTWRSWRRTKSWAGVAAWCEATSSASRVRRSSSGTLRFSSRSSSDICAAACRAKSTGAGPSVTDTWAFLTERSMLPNHSRATEADSFPYRAARAAATASPRASSEVTSQRSRRASAPPKCLHHASTARPAAVRTDPDRSVSAATSRPRAAGPNSSAAAGCSAKPTKSCARTNASTSLMRSSFEGKVVRDVFRWRTADARTAVL